MQLIIICGAPATGKTSIAKMFAEELGYLLRSKDEIKEHLYDSKPGNHGFFWYEERAKNALFDAIKSDIQGDRSIIVESNFVKSDIQRVRSLLSENVQCIEIYCYTLGLTRFKRFVNRAERGGRHEANKDRRWYITTFMECLISYIRISWPYRSLHVSAKLLKLNTTDFSKVNTAQLLSFTQDA